MIDYSSTEELTIIIEKGLTEILRLYLANIVEPETLANLHRSDYQRVNDVPNLACPDCEEVLGVPAVSKGQKWVFRMRQGYFHRKLIK